MPLIAKPDGRRLSYEVRGNGEQLVCHRVRQYLSAALPDLPAIDQAAEHLHCSVRTLSRHLAAEGTTFQVLKDELRRDIAITHRRRQAHGRHSA